MSESHNLVSEQWLSNNVINCYNRDGVMSILTIKAIQKESVFLRILLLSFMVFSLAFFIASPSVAYAEAQQKKLKVNVLGEGMFELKFEFSEELGIYRDKLVYRPNELIIAIENASSRLKLNPVKIDKGVKEVEAKRTEDGLRIVISLDDLMPYRIIKKKTALYVRFGDTSQNPPPATD